jgi:hypothetical protein
MNYSKLKTASNIIEIFHQCRNPGEEIILFEILVSRLDPPIQAFVEILHNVKLEPVLVLTIKAFWAIRNSDIKDRLKKSDDLLMMLSKQAECGTSDLIRWTAAVAIDRIGFSKVSISQNLSQSPAKIAESILDSKRRILSACEDKSKGEQKITDRNDYQSFIDFWVYGPTNELRAMTASSWGKNSSTVVEAVVKEQDIYGIIEANSLYQKLEERGYLLDTLTKKTYENELFERFTHRLCSKSLKENYPENTSRNKFKHLIISQSHFLQSENLQIRLESSSIFLDFHRNVLDSFDFIDSRWLLIAKGISDCKFDLHDGFYYKGLSYEELKKVVDNLRLASDLVSRDGVSKHFADYLSKLSKDLEYLSPGLSWNNIQAAAEAKRAAEAQYLAKQRQKEHAEEEQKRRERERIRQNEEEKQYLSKITEENRLAILREEESGQDDLPDNWLPVIIYSLPVALVSLFIIVCLGAYFTNGKYYHSLLGLDIIFAGVVLGPVAWVAIFLGLIGLFGSLIGGQFNPSHDNLAVIGACIILLFGTCLSPWTFSLLGLTDNG